MAGVKGRSGGARPNSGGARPGAGRKKKSAANKPVDKAKESVPSDIRPRDMLTLLQDIALGRTEATTVQVRAAIAAVQYTHVKKCDCGKKGERQDAAKKVASRFAQSSPPKLATSDGKKV